MRILVLGASGMAGHVVTTYLTEQGHHVSHVSGSKKLNDETVLLDITDKIAVAGYLDKNSFDAVINCIGLLVKASDSNKDMAVYINAYFPHQLEKYYENTSTKVIHLSTDCVFSGKNAPYTEASWPDGESFYDRSKALGELNNAKDLTFRMSIIGPDLAEGGIGLFNWFSLQDSEINGFTGSIWNGITTIELAKAINDAVSNNLSGVYNLVPNNNISKYELLLLFKQIFQREDIVVKPIAGVTHDKTLVCSRKDFDFIIPDYPEMIHNMKQWIDLHPGLYRHYER